MISISLRCSFLSNIEEQSCTGNHQWLIIYRTVMEPLLGAVGHLLIFSEATYQENQYLSVSTSLTENYNLIALPEVILCET